MGEGGKEERERGGGKEGDEGRKVTSYKRPRDAVMTQTMTSRDGVWEAGTGSRLRINEMSRDRVCLYGSQLNGGR